MIEIFRDGGTWMVRRVEAGRVRVEATRFPAATPAIDVLRAVSGGASGELVVVLGPAQGGHPAG